MDTTSTNSSNEDSKLTACYDSFHKRIDDGMHLIFAHIIALCYDYRYAFIITPLALSIFLGYSLLWIPERMMHDPIYLFSVENGKWWRDISQMQSLWMPSPDNFQPGYFYDFYENVDVILVRTDWGNILEQDYLTRFVEGNKYILDHMTVPYNIDNRTGHFTYRDLCMSYQGKCYENDHILFLSEFATAIQLATDSTKIKRPALRNRLLASLNFKKEEKVETYPVAYNGRTPINLAMLIAGVEGLQENGSFSGAQAVRMTYNLRQDGIYKEYSLIFYRQLIDYLNDVTSPFANGTRNGIFSNLVLDDALKKVGNKFIPYVSVTILVLIIFTYMCSFVFIRSQYRSRRFTIDWARSKPQLALLGVMTACMAVVSSYGLHMWLGANTDTIVNVMAFIVISVGVNDMYIIIAAWHRTNPAHSARDRLTACYADASISVTITSITDVLSFAVGTYTNIPAARWFCGFSAVGILFCFIYYLTFFAGCFAIFADWEEAGRNSLMPCIITLHVSDPRNTSKWSRYFNSTALHVTIEERKKKKRVKKELAIRIEHDAANETFINKFFRYYYAPWIINSYTKILVIAIYVVYLSFAIYGCLNRVEGLEPKNLAMPGDELAEWDEIVRRTFFKDAQQFDVTIFNAPNMTKPKYRAKIDEIIDEFTNYKHALGRSSMIFFFDDWLAYERESTLRTFDIDDLPFAQFYYKLYRYCTKTAEYDIGWTLSTHWIQWNSSKSDADNLNRKLQGIKPELIGDGDMLMDAFRFQFAVGGMLTTVDERQIMEDLRAIADKYSKYNITVTQWFSAFTDQYAEVGPTLFRNVSLALLCMFFICLLMIPSVVSVVLIIIAIISIDVGVIGYMTLWSVHVDCISMITIIMSIGFAVDLTAHISYAYVMAQGSQKQRVIYAIETLGWPVTQGALSTMLGMLPVVSVNAYMIKTFFKTLFLVIFLGLCHSLVFLPVAQSLIVAPIENFFTRLRHGHRAENKIRPKEIDSGIELDKI